MKKITKKHKIILSLIIILCIILSVFYYLFIPEFKYSTIPDHAYVYVDNGNFLKENYLVKYNEEIHIDIKKDKFKIYVPLSYYMEGNWEVTCLPNDSVKVEKSYKKSCRLPVYDWNKDGSGYDMQVFEFSTLKLKEIKGKLVFNYNYNNDIKNITVLIN